jgi:hypothetical protein
LVRFGFYKKSNQFEFKKKRNRTKTGSEPKPVQTDRFWFGLFLGHKPVWYGFFGLARFFQTWLRFFGLARFFSIWVRFGFYGFRLIKPKSNRISQLFQNFNQFLFTVRFFWLFFSGFLGLIGFSVFFPP